jgi:hypothetical protein
VARFSAMTNDHVHRATQASARAVAHPLRGELVVRHRHVRAAALMTTASICAMSAGAGRRGGRSPTARRIVEPRDRTGMSTRDG